MGWNGIVGRPFVRALEERQKPRTVFIAVSTPLALPKHPFCPPLEDSPLVAPTVERTGQATADSSFVPIEKITWIYLG